MINRTLTAKHKTARKGKIQGIILHDTAGSGTHNDTVYLSNPQDGRVVSVDFTVEKDGSVYQLNPNPAAYTTYHAGRATSFKGAKNAAVNHIALGIEIVQNVSNVNYPTAQVKAVAELCKSICNQYGLTAADITTHQKIITDGSRTDPRKFPFDDFWGYFNGGASSSPNPEKKTA